MIKPTIWICENKGADQIRSNCAADQRLCFRYTDSTIPLFSNPKFPASSYLSAFTSRYVSDLVGNHIVGFPTRQLIYGLVFLSTISVPEQAQLGTDYQQYIVHNLLQLTDNLVTYCLPSPVRHLNNLCLTIR